MSDAAEVSSRDVYVAALRFAFRDQFVDGEEMQWMHRISSLLGLDKEVRRELLSDIKYQARMNQLPPPSEDEGPVDLFRNFCARAWVGKGLGAEEVEVLAEFAQVLGLSREAAETCLAETAPTGKVPPSLEGLVPDPAPPEPAADEDRSDAPAGPGVSPVLVGAMVVGAGVLIYVVKVLL